MKNIIWAAMPKLLTMLLVTTVLMILGGAQHAKAQCEGTDCGAAWSTPSTILIRDTANNCAYTIQYKFRQCSTRCEVYFDKIESVPGTCCYGSTWLALTPLVKMLAKSITNYFPSFTGCSTTNFTVRFPSCWKVTTANHLAEACAATPCCIYVGGGYIPAMGNCAPPPSPCVKICTP
jgi:hypothetical protein